MKNIKGNLFMQKMATRYNHIKMYLSNSTWYIRTPSIVYTFECSTLCVNVHIHTYVRVYCSLLEKICTKCFHIKIFL